MTPWLLAGALVGCAEPEPAALVRSGDSTATNAADSGLIDRDGDGVASFIDCDDADPTVGAPTAEVCDGRDDDCDGLVDEGFPTIASYPDQDGDGYGDDAGITRGCDVPPGNVLVGGDCADDDRTTYPGAPEVCGDGVANDCVAIRTCRYTGDVDAGRSAQAAFWNPVDQDDNLYIVEPGLER